MSSGCVTSISDTNIPTPTPAKTAAAAAAMLPSLAPSSTRGGGGGGSGGGGGGGGTGGSGVSTSASTAPGSGATTPGSSSRIPLPRHLNGLGGGVRRSASMRLRGEKYHQLLGAGASAASLASFYSSSSSAAASPRTRASASAASLWGSGGGGGGGPRGTGGDARQCPSISEGASWRALRPGATAAQRGAAHDANGHPAPAAGAGATAGRYYRSLSLTGGGGGSGGPAFPSAPAASPDPGASGPAPGRQQPQPPPRRGRGASLSFCPVDDQLLLDDVLDAVGHPGAGGAEEQEDDASSLRSFGSACSAMSCDHAYFARNGTTFSGRRMKYVVHCSPHAGETEEYLTPTQRAARQIRRLKTLLQEAQREINQKDQDIFRLTKEVVELRLFKASLGASSTRDEDDEVGDSTTHKIQDTGIYGKRGGGGGGDCEAALVDEADAVRAGARAAVKALAEHLQEQEALAEEDSPRALLLHLHTSDRASSHGGEKTSSPSLADSGHFEDIVTTPEPHARGLVPALASPSSPTAPSSQQQQQQPPPSPQTQRAGAVMVAATQAHVEVEALRLRLSEEATVHVRELQQQKERHNDRVEALLQRLSDANDQYCELRTEYERAQDKIRQLEKEAESLRKNMEEHEERHKSMYLKMYMKGQEAARFEHADQVLEFAHKAPSRVSVPELLQQLQVAESELENMKQETDLRHTLAPKSALLSAREALSLWLLGTRKAMYRRIVESRAKKGELDPEITLQFLKSAIYYFLTDKENHQGHLNAIESILGYNENEKLNIEKAYRLYVRK